MALDIFEVTGNAGQTLKFLVEKDGSDQLTLVTQPNTTSYPVTGSVTVSNFPADSVNYAESENASVSVGTSDTDLLEVDVRAYNYISFEVSNGATALNKCQLQVKYHSSSTVWNPKTFGATEYTTGSGKQSGNSLISIIEASGDLNTLGNGNSGWVEINCARYASIKLVATVASGTSLVTTRSLAKLH